VKVKIRYIREAAADRESGYLEEVLSAGHQEGEWLVLDDEKYRYLVARYRPTKKAVFVRVLQAGCRWVASGLQLAPEGLVWTRSAVCALCPAWEARQRRCLECGCTTMKLELPSESCPLGRW
jgi:hypothetical protein